jgi:hypothetical protein
MFANEMNRHVGRYYGKYRGKVVDNADQKQQGAVMVTVPDVFGPEVEVLARACMPYGHFYVPPPGADVWTEFEAGDPGYPLWVGAWYPEGTAPAESPEHRVIQTPSGNTIEIVDTEGEERILVRHASNALVSIDPNGSVLIANPAGSQLHLDAENKTVTLDQQHGNQLAMDEQGTTLVNPDGTTINLVGDTVHISAAKVILDASTVAVGSDAGEPTVMGSAFQSLWDTMLTHTHVCPTGAAVASVELAPLKLVAGVHLTSSAVVT